MNYPIRANILNPKVQVQHMPQMGGRGLIAVAPIRAGELIWVSHMYPVNTTIRSWEEIQDDPILVRYAYQIGENRFSVTIDHDADPSNFYNHACEPNTWYDHSLAPKVSYFVDYVLPMLASDPAHALYEYQEPVISFLREYALWGKAPSTSDPRLKLALEIFQREVAESNELEFIVAKRDLRVGEHVTMDYATFWTISDQDFHCGCGAATCRGTISNLDYLQMPAEHASLYVRGLLTANRRAQRAGERSVHAVQK